MSAIWMSVCLVIGIVGHAINRWCDYVLAVYPNGKITIDTMNEVNDETRMSHLMKGTDPSTPFKSAMYGVVAIFMEYMGYAAIASYIYQYQHVCGIILFVAASFFAVLAAGHHVKYGLAVWMFVRSGCNHDVYQLFDELYNKGSITKSCYMGYILFVVTLIISVVITPIPLWMVIFTVLPVFIAMVPFKIIGTLHYSAIISFAGWLILIAVL